MLLMTDGVIVRIPWNRIVPTITLTILAFFTDAPPIRIAYETDRAPLSFTGSDGEFHGVQRDILDEISRISGLKFDYVPCRREQTELTYLEENKLRVISGVRYCRFSAERG